MPLLDAPVAEELRSATSSTVSLEHIRSVESVSSDRSTATGSSAATAQQNSSFRPYVDLPHLEPLALQTTEPRLDELLMKVAETQDLDTLEAVQLRISSTMICIQHLEVFLPRLQSLDLSGSELSSLRDLGTQLRIRRLNVSRCGLDSLDGTTGLMTLLELVADENNVRCVGQLCNLTELRVLSLRSNKIPTYSAVSFISLCPALLELDLRDNPVTQLAEYRDSVHDMMPQLKLLDGQPFYDTAAAADESLSSSDYSSSTGNSHQSLADAKRCTSAEFEELTHVSSRQFDVSKLRYGSCGGSNSAGGIDGAVGSMESPRIDISADTAPIAGNIVLAARRRRRKSAWTTRSNSSASTLSSSRSSSAMSGDRIAEV